MRSILSLTVLLSLCALSFAADMVDNPAYQKWSKYNPGTTVTYSQEMQMPGPMPMVMTMESKQTLIEVTPEKATVETATSNSMMPGRSQTHRMTIDAKIEKEKLDAPPEMDKAEVKQLGDETVKVNDKEYICKVTEFTGEKEGMKATGKTWTAADVPGGMVKMEMNGTREGMNMTVKMTLKSFEVK